MSSITSFETCLSTSQPSFPPSSRIKPSVNWFRSFVSTFRIHVTFISIVRCFPLFFSFFSSLFSSPSPSSLFFYLYPLFFFFFTSRHVSQIYSQHALCSSTTRYCNVSDIRSQWIHDLQLTTNDSRIIAKRSSIEAHFTLMISSDDIERGKGEREGERAALHF